MEKELIPYEQALDLKELGFDEECFSYYNTTEILISSEFLWRNSYSKGTDVVAPLYQQAFRWFREKHRIEAWVQPHLSPEPRRNEAKFWYGGRTSSTGDSIGIYDTYPQAELECLKHIIQFIKEHDEFKNKD
jgi:hypothetical protein